MAPWAENQKSNIFALALIQLCDRQGGGCPIPLHCISSITVYTYVHLWMEYSVVAQAPPSPLSHICGCPRIKRFTKIHFQPFLLGFRGQKSRKSVFRVTPCTYIYIHIQLWTKYSAESEGVPPFT